MAERNEKTADEFASKGLKVTANGYYLRAPNFIASHPGRCRSATTRMLPTYNKARRTFDRAWELQRAPFERIQVKWENQTLDGYFRKPGGPRPGKNYPVVIAFQGADTMAEATIMGGAGAYLARGMAYLAVDFPGQGRGSAAEGFAPAAGYRSRNQSDDRLPRDSQRCGREKDWVARHQHGRLRSSASGQQRTSGCGGVHEQRVVRSGARSFRLLAVDSGAGALDHRRAPGRCQENAAGVHTGRAPRRSAAPC